MDEHAQGNLGGRVFPDEIWLLIMTYLDPYHMTRLQQVSRHLQSLCLDDKLWKLYCFERSAWYQILTSRRATQDRPHPALDSRRGEPAESSEGAPPVGIDDDGDELMASLRHRSRKAKDMASWDPSFPTEHVSWYDEYIQREGPVCVNWMEAPKASDSGQDSTIEVRGVALYSPYDGDDGLGTNIAVAPLDDGAVCLWDVNGARGRRGGIIAKSQPDLLYKESSGANIERLRSQRIDSSIADRVSVDNYNHRAYLAVQSHLIEVDLHRLDVVSRDSFEWSITTLSSIHPEKPLAVGTSLGVHLHDFRTRARVSQDAPERVDREGWKDADVFKALFDPTPLPPYASLSQPTPTSILYLPRRDSSTLVTDDIYVSGRFSSILHYDRRKFPSIVDSIHSGALVNSLAALPYPFFPADHPDRKGGNLSAEEAEHMKSQPGSTLIAGGSYNQKGSLEIHSVGPRPMVQSLSTKNRYTAAASPLLFVANHGTKIVVSDGSGQIKWFERDGLTECRRLRIGHGWSDGGGGMFTSEPQLDDVARKIVSTRTKHGKSRPNNDNILFWTGERVGMVTFTTHAMFHERDFSSHGAEEAAEDKARREYADKMRDALERQADEVRFMSGLGLGTRSSFGL